MLKIFCVWLAKSTSLPSKNSTTSDKIPNGTSFQAVPGFTTSGRIIAAIPSTKNMLEILLPKILPIAISDDPDAAENKLITNSGAEVPKATTVRPITIGEIPNRFANEAAPFTKISPPMSKIARPMISKNIANAIMFYIYFCLMRRY